MTAGIYGAAGYTGRELLALLHRHPDFSVAFATSDSSSGEVVQGVRLIPAEQADPSQAEVIFLCTPHGASAKLAAGALAEGARVVDLSADLRLKTPEAYAEWYGHPHPHPELLPTPYGLPEFNRATIEGQRRVANPGCYPTCTLLALRPLAQAGAMRADGPLVVDAKSGVSGAGRKASLDTHFVEVFGDLKPYNIGRVHRHVGEIEQELGAVAPDLLGKLVFSPHLLPVDRGLLATCYVPLAEGWTPEQARHLMTETYCHEPLVNLLPPGETVRLRDAARTNGALISLHPVSESMLIVVAAIDNLLKGASGQAVENMNLALGLEQRAGLS
ncbi:MAG: N-acetyl-gamma-glutamyl-phosphate reductase [Anaerolineae bacterium]|nr:N-acetyl-gamma-glutamyl-phosphate reductase [Anaerolineae bacterium]